MNVDELKKLEVPDFVVENFKKRNITILNPVQIKAVEKGILEDRNMLICTPTGSGKTAAAILAITKRLVRSKGKAVYLVPLKALANEKYNDFKELFNGTGFEVGMSTGDMDSRSDWLGKCSLLLLTVEKMDSLLRHKVSWIYDVSVVVIDEIHLLNDPGRGPTLEILITILRKLLPKAQFIGLSATIGNPEELAKWLDAELVIDNWRPVKLHQGVYRDGVISFKK
ncbi:DEAD/DEAH box helicase [Candidatus Woesearchaeota archaeon]|nr:DEAD/DEAH box helicase [Candidatus Woesearchaeota archaeon]